MKKLIPALLAAILLTGCASQAENSKPAPATLSTTAATTTTVPEITESDSTEDKKLLITGIWSVSINGVPYGLFTIEDNGDGGEVIRYEDGISDSFSYEIGVNEITLYLDSYGDAIHLDVQGGDLSAADLTAEDGTEISIRNISDSTVLPEFYDNSELCVLAEEYYERHHGERPPLSAAQTNEDGTVTIQLYENLSDHNSTWAWYRVDRETACGIDDILLNDICLTE